MAVAPLTGPSSHRPARKAVRESSRREPPSGLAGPVRHPVPDLRLSPVDPDIAVRNSLPHQRGYDTHIRARFDAETPEAWHVGRCTQDRRLELRPPDVMAQTPFVDPWVPWHIHSRRASLGPGAVNSPRAAARAILGASRWRLRRPTSRGGDHAPVRWVAAASGGCAHVR